MADIVELCAAIDAETMFQHLHEFSRRVKLSGTEAEFESFAYLQAALDGYGLRTTLMRHDAYISLPGAARIAIGAASPDCITHSFSCSSPAGGTAGTVIDAGAGRSEDFAAIDARGRIVLLDGIANPAASLRASQAGAIGQLHVSPHEHLHEMCISPVWGSPDDAALAQLPRTVVLSLRAADGAAIRARMQAGETVDAVLHAAVDTGWRQTPLLVAELDGPAPDGPFVMFSGHHDTWHLGVMDNGGANATMLEIARLFAPHRGRLRRGLRLCFWSGHSHGRYSGSAWYADHHWDELATRCLAHVNVDSTGARGNTVMADALSSAELTGLARDAVGAEGQALTGLRMSRAGDQSFWGVGIPSVFMAMGEQPAGSADSIMGPALGGGGPRQGAGLGWWWHTPDDTLDKMDRDLLVRDTRVYVRTLWRLLTDAILPLDYGAAAAALDAELATLGRALADRLDLSPLQQRAARLRTAVSALSGEPDRVNAALMAIGRALVPMDYTSGDRFAHDPAIGQAPYPVLDKLRRLAAAPAGSDEAKFLAVAAVRSLNRLAHALDTAIAAAQLR